VLNVADETVPQNVLRRLEAAIDEASS
jgi:hypothetical protein